MWPITPQIFQKNKTNKMQQNKHRKPQKIITVIQIYQ